MGEDESRWVFSNESHIYFSADRVKQAFLNQTKLLGACN